RRRAYRVPGTPPECDTRRGLSGRLRLACGAVVPVASLLPLAIRPLAWLDRDMPVEASAVGRHHQRGRDGGARAVPLSPAESWAPAWDRSQHAAGSPGWR